MAPSLCQLFKSLSLPEMKLTELLSGLAEVVEDVEISGLALDSRQVQPGYAFIALAGSVQHGLEYAEQALSKGAGVIIYDPAGKGKELAESFIALKLQGIEDLSQKLGGIAARFFKYPSRSLDVIGVTGTNGKTSCTQFLGQALDHCGVIGTLGWGNCDTLQNTLNTTPDALAIQNMLNVFVNQQKKTVVMEVSSQGLHQGRVNGVSFSGALFTNLSRDHLDYHGNMEAYRAIKLKFFSRPELKFAVINLDDDCAGELLTQVGGKIKCWGFSCQTASQFSVETVRARNIKQGLKGFQFDLEWRGRINSVKTALSGAFNLENVLAVLTVLLALEIPLANAIERIERLRSVPGRMEKMGGGDNPVVFIDYAHSPDALEKVLAAMKTDWPHQLKLVFGCGGDRDQGKRQQMGKIAERWADEIIVTDDNPRSESPQAIVNDILKGCDSKKTRVIHDRRQAIRFVIENSVNTDCILIAGKGHENYQEVKGVRRPFSDRQIVKKALIEKARS